MTSVVPCRIVTSVPEPPGVPSLRQVVLDTTDARGLAEFWRQLLDLAYRPGDELPAPNADDSRGRDWLVLHLRDDGGGKGGVALAVQQVDALPASTWPDPAVPQRLHLDLTVPDVAALDAAHERALGLGARLLQDRCDDPEEPLRVYADLAGHPFCVFVG